MLNTLLNFLAQTSSGSLGETESEMAFILVMLAWLAGLIALAGITSLVGALWLKLAGYLLKLGPIPYAKAYGAVFLAALVVFSLQALVVVNTLAGLSTSRLMWGVNQRVKTQPPSAESFDAALRNMLSPVAFVLMAIFSMIATALILQRLLGTESRQLSFSDAATLSFAHHVLSLFGGLFFALLANLMILRLMSF